MDFVGLGVPIGLSCAHTRYFSAYGGGWVKTHLTFEYFEKGKGMGASCCHVARFFKTASVASRIRSISSACMNA